MVMTSFESSSQSSSNSFNGFEFVSNAMSCLIVSVDNCMDVEPATVDEIVVEVVGGVVWEVVGEVVEELGREDVGEDFNVSVGIVSVSERMVVRVVAILGSLVVVVPCVVCVIWSVVKLD